MRDTPAEPPDAPESAAAQFEADELLDGTPQVRAWVIAIAAVWVQVAALLWGLAVLP